MARAARGLSRRLPGGLPAGIVAALAALVLVAILYTVATREPKEPRGYGELTLFPEGCAVDRARQSNVRGCESLGPRVYRVTFTKSLAGSTPLVSRGSCCPGAIGASIENERAVVVVVDRRITRPLRASVLVP